MILGTFPPKEKVKEGRAIRVYCPTTGREMRVWVTEIISHDEIRGLTFQGEAVHAYRR